MNRIFLEKISSERAKREKKVPGERGLKVYTKLNFKDSVRQRCYSLVLGFKKSWQNEKDYELLANSSLFKPRVYSLFRFDLTLLLDEEEIQDL